jgi:hypothetical protein
MMIRLSGCLVLRLSKGMSTARRYLNMAEYWQWKQACESGQAESSLHVA